MPVDTLPDTARAVVMHACHAVTAVRDIDYWKISDTDLLSPATSFEDTARLMFAAQVHLAGELDTRRIADNHGCTSTAALLRQNPDHLRRRRPDPDQHRESDPAAAPTHRRADPTPRCRYSATPSTKD